MAKNIAIIRVSSALIRDALAFPDNAKIIDIQLDFTRPDVFMFEIEHPDLPEAKDGGVYQEVEPVFTVDYDKKPSTWITCDWRV